MPEYPPAMTTPITRSAVTPGKGEVVTKSRLGAGARGFSASGGGSGAGGAGTVCAGAASARASITLMSIRLYRFPDLKKQLSAELTNAANSAQACARSAARFSSPSGSKPADHGD